MSTPTALDSFLDKWRQRWPEWAVAEVFVPVPQRSRVVAWFALLQEFDDILNIAGDPLPADAKLGWWATELGDWARHRSRHPLGRLLEPLPAPWGPLAAALPALVAARERPVDPAAALAALDQYCEAVAAAEAVVLGGPAPQPRQLAAQVLATRLAEAGPLAVPRSLLGEQADAASAARAQCAWADALLDRWPSRTRGAGPRRLWAALARARLRPLASGRRVTVHPLRTLWTAWRAARG